MKNSIVCSNCNAENDLFRFNCTECGSLLRERVVNIDLWSTIWKIIETPSIAFKKIIHAENKNYTLFLALLLSVKLTFNSFFIKSIFGLEIDYQNFIGFNFLIGLSSFLLLFLIVAWLQKIISKRFDINTRFKDNYSALVYAGIPTLISLFILFPVEFALFGKYWLFFNPSPYFIKPVAAYVFSGMEFLILVWMIILFVFQGYVSTKNKVYSILFSLGFITAIGVMSYSIPYL